MTAALEDNELERVVYHLWQVYTYASKRKQILKFHFQERPN